MMELRIESDLTFKLSYTHLSQGRNEVIKALVQFVVSSRHQLEDWCSNSWVK